MHRSHAIVPLLRNGGGLGEGECDEGRVLLMKGGGGKGECDEGRVHLLMKGGRD